MPVTRKFLSSLPPRKVQLQDTISGPPIIQALESALQPMQGTRNRYKTYQSFLRMDPEINNAVTRLSLLVQFAYKGVVIRAGKELTTDEETLLKNAKDFAKTMDFRGRFFYIAKHLLRDGDEVFVTHTDNAAAANLGVQQIQPLPITKLTGVTDEGQIGKTDTNIVGPAMIYVVNESDESKRQKFPQNDKQKVYHVALDNHAEEIYDNMGRYTFGVWSESPLEALRTRVLWKQAILIADILWRYRNVPREVHELDVSMFKPEDFTGETPAARLSNYQTAIRAYLRAYADEIKKKKVDQGYVIPSGTKIYYTEPKRVAYTSPNEVIDQINESIIKGLSAYDVEAGTYATALVVSSYVVLLPDLIAVKIKDILLEVLKMHLRKKHNTTDENLEKVDIRISLVLDIFRGELIRQMALLAATGTQTIDELRDYIGQDPITDKQAERLIEIVGKGRSGQYVQTLLDLLRDSERRTEPRETTPESKREIQETT
ncbi:MAG: hypothetical protein AM326_03090 [Candidatus Thorarchaeota archaeon SMTZ-45]|nr:MAG: hypothetical protein AM326_03090 [Candidatus Thorarchaeota archaeon SMTZ-45]